MPVVDIEELYSTGRRQFVTGWRVTSWDGYHETSVCVPAHKGEPADAIGADSREDWQRHHRDRAESEAWARKVWQLARRTDWTPDIGDTVAFRTMLRPSAYTNYDGRTVSIGEGDVTMFMVYRDKNLLFTSDGSLSVTTSVFTLPTPTLNKHRRRAVLAESKDEFLWELVFAHPEAEWVDRWGLFTDALQEGRWGGEWARVGECLAASGWRPKHPLSEGLVSWYVSPISSRTDDIVAVSDRLVQHVVDIGGFVLTGPPSLTNNQQAVSNE